MPIEIKTRYIAESIRQAVAERGDCEVQGTYSQLDDGEGYGVREDYKLQRYRTKTMEGTINIQQGRLAIEKLPEELYLATSEQIQGLVARGRTITETLEIARDVARKLLESQHDSQTLINQVGDKFDYPLIVAV